MYFFYPTNHDFFASFLKEFYTFFILYLASSISTAPCIYFQTRSACTLQAFGKFILSNNSGAIYFPIKIHCKFAKYCLVGRNFFLIIVVVRCILLYSAECLCCYNSILIVSERKTKRKPFNTIHLHVLLCSITIHHNKAFICARIIK